MPNTRVDTDFLYLYGVILTEELQESEVPSILGIDQKKAIIKIYKDLAAVITPVNASGFSQKQLDLQLKDTEWLRVKAFHHHEVITALHQQFTVLPMSFCTIFQNEVNLASLFTEQYDVILQKLHSLKDKQEWNLKLYCNTKTALAYVIDHNKAVVDLRAQLASMPKGKQFLMKKKLDYLIASELEIEQSNWWKQISAELESDTSKANLRKNWSKEVTERQDDMVVNCDFLIEKSKVELFFNRIQELEKTYEPLGCTFQVTGPWPPYHFSKMTKEF